MKYRHLFLTATAAICLVACDNNNWQNHYFVTDTEVSNDQLIIVDESTESYLSGQADMSSMFSFLSENGVFNTLQEKGQLHTILVVENADFKRPEEELAYVANSHVTDISLSPSNLSNGERILMWHGKFVTVGVDSLGQLGHLDHITFNGSHVKSVIKALDGYIYVLSSMIETPISLYDFIQELPDDYSMFREMILASGGKQFDKTNSKAIGVDATGNTLYDTVWIYTNDFFDAKNFSLSSESLTATMLLFSNDVINDAMRRADSTLKAWGLERDPEIIRKWILQVAFYNKKYSSEEMESTASIKSIYDKYWKYSEQQTDTQNPINVSNGVIYEVKRLLIPTNVLIYRIKDYYRNYEYCSAEEKSMYFSYHNLKNLDIKVEVKPWTPDPGVWPEHGSTSLSCYCEDPSDYYYMRMQLVHPVTDAFGNPIGVAPYKIPPGKYRFAMGFAQNQNVAYKVTVYAKLDSGLEKLGESDITVDSSTKFHLDRGTTLSDTWPEGYKEVRDQLTNSKKNNYDTDGGGVIDELVIPDLNGDGSAIPLVIHVENATGTSTRLVFHHWCLRPISNN